MARFVLEKALPMHRRLIRIDQEKRRVLSMGLDLFFLGSVCLKFVHFL